MTIEKSTVQYAIVIDYDDSTTVVDVGLIDGKIKFITGRQTTGFTYEDGSIADGFLTGYLIKEPMKALGTKIDISTGGNFNSLNSATVTIDNTTKYIQNLLSNEIYLTNSRVQIYVVIDDVMYARFGGVVNDIRYNEKNVVFECKDLNELLFKQVPENAADQLTVGNIAYAKLKKETTGDVINIKTFYGRSYTQSPYDNKLFPKLQLAIDKEFWLSHTRAGSMKNLFIRPRRFGSDVNDDDFDTAVRIIDNGQPEIDGDNSIFVDVFLERPFDELLSENIVGRNGFSTPTTLNYSPTLFNVDEEPNKFMFDIIDFKTKYFISGREIEDLELDENGRPILYTYDEDLDDGTDQSNPWIRVDAAIDYDIDGDNPFIVLRNNTSDIKTKTYEEIRFTDCKYKFHDSPPAGDTDRTVANTTGERLQFTQFKIDNRPWQDGSNMIDGDYTTTAWNGDTTSGPRPSGVGVLRAKNLLSQNTDGVTAVGQLSVMLDLTVPDSFNFADYDTVYLGWGMQWQITNNAFRTAKNMEFKFDTLDVAYKYTLGDGGNAWNLPEFKNRQFVLPPSNRLTMKLTNGVDDPDNPGRDELTELCKAGLQEGPIEQAKVIFSPFMSDNPTVPDGAMQIFSSFYKLGFDFNTNAFDSYLELEQKLKDNMKLENNPVVIDDNGEKHIFLYPRVDPFDHKNESYKFDHQIYDLHLIGEREVSSEELYVKVKGQKLIEADIQVENVHQTFQLLLEDYNDLGEINYVNTEDYRSGWDCARIISEPTGSKGLIKNLAQQSFVGVYTNRSGIIELDAFKDDVVYDEGQAGWGPTTTKTLWYHDNTNIIDGSIKSVTTTNVSKIYNDINLNYNKNYASDEFTRTYYVTQVDQPPFPEQSLTRTFSEATYLQTIGSGEWAMNSTDPNLIDRIGVNYYGSNDPDDTQQTELARLRVGDKLSVETPDEETYFNFQIDGITNWTAEGNYEFDVTLLDTGLVPISSGVVSSFNLPYGYEDYSNIPSYTDARSFWENGHETWKRNRVVNPLPANLANCEWYRDLREFDPNAIGPLSSSIHYYMENLVEWVTKPKNMIKYSIPLNEQNITIELLDRIVFKDILITDDTEVIGWVTAVQVNLGKAIIDLEITTVPADLVPIYRIIDESSTTILDTIDEEPNTGENVDEDFIMWEI